MTSGGNNFNIFSWESIDQISCFLNSIAYCIVIQTLNKTETGVYHLRGTIGGLGPLVPPPLATRLLYYTVQNVFLILCPESRIGVTRERDRQTDRQTERIVLAIARCNIVRRVLDRNSVTCMRIMMKTTAANTGALMSGSDRASSGSKLGWGEFLSSSVAETKHKMHSTTLPFDWYGLRQVLSYIHGLLYTSAINLGLHDISHTYDSRILTDLFISILVTRV